MLDRINCRTLLPVLAAMVVAINPVHSQGAKTPPPAPAKASTQAAPSSHELLKTAISVFKDSIDRKNTLLVPGNELFIDRDDLDLRLRPLGFARDYPNDKPSVKGRTFGIKAWNELKICRGTGAVESCTLPPRTVIVRFFNARWSAENAELMVLMGVYRRSEVDFNNPAIGGSVATFYFRRRGGQWVLAKIGKVVSA